MKLLKTFSRSILAGPTLWTQDVLPTDAAGNSLPPGTLTSATNNGSLSTDFSFSCPRDRLGFPIRSIGVSYQGPAGAGTLAATLYVFDTLTKQYFAVPNSPVTLKAGFVNLFNALMFVDDATRSANLDASPTGVTGYSLIVTPAGTVVGPYVFGFGALTST